MKASDLGSATTLINELRGQEEVLDAIQSLSGWLDVPIHREGRKLTTKIAVRELKESVSEQLEDTKSALRKIGVDPDQ